MPAPSIYGNLDFSGMAGAANAFQGLGGTPQQAMAALGPAYASSYGAALGLNQQNYGNIIKGYGAVGDAMNADQQRIDAGYGAGKQESLDAIAGYGRSQSNILDEQYARAQGAGQQDLINRGLGNSSVSSSVNRGLALDRARAGIDLGDRISQQRLGVIGQYNMGQLGYGERAANANTGLGLDQLRFMNSVSAPYPNAGMYGQLASQYGMAQQAQQDREQVNRVGGAASIAANRPQAGPVSMGGGAGFFRPMNPDQGVGLGGEAPQIGYGMPVSRGPVRPPLGAVGSDAAGNAAQAYFQSGLSNYTPPSGAGFSGGFGSQGYGGEDMPYFEPQAGPQQQPSGYQSPYGAMGYGGFGGAPSPFSLDYTPPEAAGGAGYYGASNYGAAAQSYGGLGGGLGSLYGSETGLGY